MEKYTIARITDSEDNVCHYYTQGYVNKVQFGYYALGMYATLQMVENDLTGAELQYCDMVGQHTVKVTHLGYPKGTGPTGTQI
jgi:hypothetical protein